MLTLATIGYEGATVDTFLDALRSARIETLVDVRAVAMSRRPGFAKTKLAANLDGAGIAYMHLRRLGTPAEGRAAARSGRHDEMKRIFADQLATDEAQDELETLADLIRTGRRIAILCFEADPRHCHRNIVAQALGERIPGLVIEHLHPMRADAD